MLKLWHRPGFWIIVPLRVISPSLPLTGQYIHYVPDKKSGKPDGVTDSTARHEKTPNGWFFQQHEPDLL